jgi:hypothetical protein
MGIFHKIVINGIILKAAFKKISMKNAAQKDYISNGKAI